MLTDADALIFDLDGRRSGDTCATCAKGWNRVIERNAITYRTMVAEDVRAICGRPHDNAIATAFPGLSPADLELVTRETMAEDNAIVALEGGTLYPGALDVIPRLAARIPLLIVSNCQAGYIEVFLTYSGLAQCFTDFECWGNTGQTKAENLAAVIARRQLSDRSSSATPKATAKPPTERVRFVQRPGASARSQAPMR